MVSYTQAETGKTGAETPPLLINKRKRKKDKTRTIFIIVMIGWQLLTWAVGTIYVNIDTFVLSFQHKTAYGGYALNKNIFENYIKFFKEFNSPTSLWGTVIANSLMYFVLNDFIIIPFEVLLTYFLYKKIAGYKVFRIIFFIPGIISMTILIMVYRFMFDSQIGFMDSLLTAIGLEKCIPEFGWFATRSTGNGVIIGYCIWSGLAGGFLVLAGAMGRIPEELIEAGKIDGVGFFRELWQITIPLIGSTLAILYMSGTSVIFTFFLQVKLLTGGGPNGQTSTIMLTIMDSVLGDASDLSMAATIGMVVAVVGTPLVLLTRYIVDKVFPAYEF